MTALITLVVLSIVAPLAALAHEGHDHTVMGTVKSVQDKHLEVQDKDGKTATFMITDKTKIVRGKTAAMAQDIRVGERVVVIGTMENEEGSSSATGKHSAMMIAKEIRLGSSAAKK
jgi:hypothetical protein